MKDVLLKLGVNLVSIGPGLMIHGPKDLLIATELTACF